MHSLLWLFFGSMTAWGVDTCLYFPTKLFRCARCFDVEEMKMEAGLATRLS